MNTLTVGGAPMNVNIPPFNNEKAQAVNYAIDRDALVNLFGARCWPLPVSTPPGSGATAVLHHTGPGEKWSAPDIEK
jgi:peptide/nickel transport system substrate-binding protein